MIDEEIRNRIEKVLNENQIGFFSSDHVVGSSLPKADIMYAIYMTPRTQILLYGYNQEDGITHWALCSNKLTNYLGHDYSTYGQYLPETEVSEYYETTGKMLLRLRLLVKKIPAIRFKEKLMLNVLEAEARKIFNSVFVDNENCIHCYDAVRKYQTNLMITPTVDGIDWQTYEMERGKFEGKPEYTLKSMKEFLNKNKQLSRRNEE